MENCSLPQFLKEKLYADFRTSYADGLSALVESMESLVREYAAFDATSSVAFEGVVVRAFRTARTGNLFLSMTDDPVLRLWQISDGRPERALFPRCCRVCLGPSGSLVVAGLRNDLFGRRLLVFTTTGELCTSHHQSLKAAPAMSLIIA